MSELDKAGLWLTWGPVAAALVGGYAAHRWLGGHAIVTLGAAGAGYVIAKGAIERKIAREAGKAVAGAVGSFFGG